MESQELVYNIGNPYVVANSIVNSSFYSWIKLPNSKTGNYINVANNNTWIFNAADGQLTAQQTQENFIFVLVQHI